MILWICMLLIASIYCCFSVCTYMIGMVQPELMCKEVVFPMMNCFKSDPIISRPVAGSGCKRHKVLVLNPVSAANLTLLIGSVVVREHSGLTACPLNILYRIKLLHWYQFSAVSRTNQDLRIKCLCIVAAFYKVKKKCNKRKKIK